MGFLQMRTAPNFDLDWYLICAVAPTGMFALCVDALVSYVLFRLDFQLSELYSLPFFHPLPPPRLVCIYLTVSRP